jgi:hypothetical protein
MLATHGEHRFFAEHESKSGSLRAIDRQYSDVREKPIVYGGYSVAWRHRTSVRISPQAYKELKAHFLDIATKESVAALEREFSCAPFEPYAGVIRQMFSILRAVNRARRVGGLRPVPRESVRVRRQVVRPFANYSFELKPINDDEILPLAA